ncbi:gp53-like domain-containing protein [Lysobacter capsici]|uniref:gp53-like domain-containing protein n=1 Tax=Lysobacter capsici TaxID=435897 RepID=UPI00287B8E5C|nr:hypothetical protein [Lysobacter capsici]WND79379.1 hypothetical protein RJ610_19060 [Lysobacter capsici]WND84575.1 hypothetical protein RJ609_19075 [Lysobacter capsici]
MAAFRVLDPFQTFLNQNSTGPAAGGRFDFFEAGTTTPKAVYANPGLSVSNGASIELDAAGRLSVDCWGDGSYRARQYDADGTLIKELDDIQPTTSGGLAIPTPLEAGAVLSNDGSILQWLIGLFVPDPSGQTNKVLSNDGTLLLWKEDVPPPVVTPDIVVAANSFRAGVSSNTSKFFVQWGAGSVAASGQTAANANVSFPTAFTDTPTVIVVPKSFTVAAEGQIPAVAVVNQSPTGFSVAMNTDDYTRNGSRITNAVPFDWVAIGHLTVA